MYQHEGVCREANTAQGEGSALIVSKRLYNLFLAVQQIRRATLAGFSNVYTKFHKSIIHITVLYELIKRTTVMWLITTL